MKRSGAFRSLIRGVSEQVPHARVEGQQWAQDNFLADPVHGLARRHGSVMQDEVDVTAVVGDAITTATAADIGTFRHHEFMQQGITYSLLYRHMYRPLGSTAPNLICVNADTRKFVPVTVDPADTLAADVLEEGVQTVATAGRFVLLAPRARKTQLTTNTQWASKQLNASPLLRNDLCAAAWVRGGSYSRTYSVKATVRTPSSSPVTISAAYKTMPAAYPGVLDTSSVSVYRLDPAGGTATITENFQIPNVSTPTVVVERRTFYVHTDSVHIIVPGPAADTPMTATTSAPAPGEYRVNNGVYEFNAADIGKDIVIKYTHDNVLENPNYQKQVNAITEAYTTAVNQHTAAAAADIAPESIAQKLVDLLNAAAVAAGHATATPFSRDGAHILSSECTALAVDDGGSGDFLRGAAQEVNSLEGLTDRHYFGKIVRVTPRAGGLSYYVEAFPKLSSGGALFGEVVWKECAGVQYIPTFLFLLGTVEAGTLYIASSPSLLASLTGLAVPGYAPSKAGDELTSAPFGFLGSYITHMTMTQDRLVIVAGGTVAMSASGDYFNFFRKSVLTITDDDPIEVFAVGREDDRITASALMDGTLVFFGERAQYGINGRENLKPGTAHISVIGTSQGTNAISPASTGNTLFFTQPNEGKVTVHQFSTGAFEGTLEPYEVAPQLDSYFEGEPLQLLALSAPSMVFMRTSGPRSGIYVYSFMDSRSEGRLYDAWTRWTWSFHLGTLAGILRLGGDLGAVYLRQGAGSTWLVLDLFKRDAALSANPYLDSLRPYDAPGSLAGMWPGREETFAAFKASVGTEFLLGRHIADVGDIEAVYPSKLEHLVAGVDYGASVALTSPYERTRDGQAILNSSLTLTALAITVANSVAMRAVLTDLKLQNRTEIESWVNRPLGSWVLGTQPIASSALVDVGVFADVAENIVVLESRDWFPLTITSIEWVGQFFTQRR